MKPLKKRKQTLNRIIGQASLSLVVLLLCLVASATVRAEQVLLISAQDSLPLIASGDAVLVDTRHKNSYAKAWIAGSINIPSAFIKTKSWLKPKKIILVDEGFGMEQQLKIAIDLNNRGFNAKVLIAGLNGWSQQNQKINGDFFVVQNFTLTHPRLAMLERYNPEYLYIDATKKQSALTKTTFPNAKALNKDVAFSMAMQEIIVRNKPLVILVLTDANPHQQIRDQYSKISSVPIFFVEDGLAGITLYIRNQQALHKPRSERTKTIGACSTCPQKKESN